MLVLPSLIDTLIELKPELVVIESQLTNGFFGSPQQQQFQMQHAFSSGNITMKVFSHVIQALLCLKMSSTKIHFVNGAATIPLCERISATPEYLEMWEPEMCGLKRTKAEKKKFAVRSVLSIVTDDERGILMKHKKKDDLSDAFLQALAFVFRTGQIKRKRLNNEKETTI